MDARALPPARAGAAVLITEAGTTPDTSTSAGSCATGSTRAEIEPRFTNSAAASAMRVGPMRPAIVFEFAIGDLPAWCRFGTEPDKTNSVKRRAGCIGPSD
jgi:hypothetical protein